MALSISWKQKLTNQQLYGTLPTVSSKIAYRRMNFAGHRIGYPELCIKTRALATCIQCEKYPILCDKHDAIWNAFYSSKQTTL